MKNLALATLLMLLTFGMNAQVTYWDDPDYFKSTHNTNAKYHKHIADSHITDVKEYAYSRKQPSGVVRFEVKYDSRGNILENIKYNKHGQMKSDYKYQYNDSNRVTSNIEFNKKGKAQWGQFWTYDKSGNITLSRYWYKDTSKTSRWTFTYNSNNNPTEATFYTQKGKLDGRTSYEYYDDGSKKKTTTYNHKGKVTGVWNYDCNPIGKSQESKMKDTSKICVHYETDKNGNPVKVKEEYTKGGKLFKYRLRNISKYDKDNHFIERITTKMNGKETWHSVSDYDAQGNETEWRQYVSNSTTVKKHWTYTYNNSGDVIQSIVYLKPSSKGSIIKYVYN